MGSAEEVLETVQTLLASVKRLEALYPGRSFTLDGHIVGSIGEVLAAELYGLELLPPSTERHDAIGPGGRDVQVKLTQAQRVAMYSDPEHLLVLGLTSAGMLEEIYNGPGSDAWARAGKRQKNGQRSVAVSHLRDLNKSVPPRERIDRNRTPTWFDVEEASDRGSG